MTAAAEDLPPDRRSRLQQLVGQYAESHRHPTNVAIHWVCVPIIVWCALALLHVAHPWACYVAIAGSLAYYLRLSWKMAVAMGVFAVLCVLSFPLVPMLGWTALGIFVAAWVAQFIGHEIEGKKPSFLEDVQFLLVGPLFLLNKGFFRFRLSP